jgi:hypothetical protein
MIILKNQLVLVYRYIKFTTNPVLMITIAPWLAAGTGLGVAPGFG